MARVTSYTGTCENGRTYFVVEIWEYNDQAGQFMLTCKMGRGCNGRYFNSCGTVMENPPSNFMPSWAKATQDQEMRISNGGPDTHFTSLEIVDNKMLLTSNVDAWYKLWDLTNRDMHRLAHTTPLVTANTTHELVSDTPFYGMFVVLAHDANGTIVGAEVYEKQQSMSAS